MNNEFDPTKRVNQVPLELYYERYLRTLHSELTEDEIQRCIAEDLEETRIRRFIEGLQQMDDAIREKYPHLNWTTWFDDFKSIP